MKVRLYGIPGSHPVRAARLMLEYKGIPYKRVDLLPVLSRPLIRVLGFPGNRVPALKIDGRKIQGSRAIARELDRIRPDPPLFPEDRERRKAVEEAERWGDEVFQQYPRTISWWTIKRDRKGSGSFLEEARLGLPTRVLVATSGPIVWMASRLNQSNDANVRASLAKLPELLAKIDAWIADGTLNGDRLSAADFQIGTSVRLLMCFEDLAPAIEGHPAAILARRVLPVSPGYLRATFPPEWLAPLQQLVSA